MIRQACLTVFILVLIAGAALAQTATPDPAPPTPQAITPAVPFQATTSPSTVVPSIDDARLASCAASTLPNFMPYTTRYGDFLLADLLIGSTTVTPTQLAALNCLNDSFSVPIGATIWLPGDAFLVADPHAAINVSGETAQIISYSSDTTSVLNDQEVTFTWEAQGQAAYLYPCVPPSDSPCMRPNRAYPLPTNYSIPVENFHRLGEYRFRLEVIGVDGVTEAVTRDVTISVTCAQQWLGGPQMISVLPVCPEDPPRTVTAVWQPFEGGVMMWFSDTQQIYVMTNADGRVQVFQDAFVEGMPDPDATAPEGLLSPIRGFGLVWQALGGAEGSGLGWAMAQEIGFDSARQPAGRTSYTTYIQGPGETVYALTEVPGMDMGYWAQVAG